jgi:hypothetical protein
MTSPWVPEDAVTVSVKRHAPATLRNREPIVEVLRRILPAKGSVLEVASGSGEHIVHFAEAFPQIDWQPSDPSLAALASIMAWSDESGLSNLRPPMRLDAASPPDEWPLRSADAVLCINMVHISPWTATLGLFEGAAALLPAGAPLYLYGPFRQSGAPLAPSNAAFDDSLRAQNAAWGLRDLDDVTCAAGEAGFSLSDVVPMPANNLSVTFSRK